MAEELLVCRVFVGILCWRFVEIVDGASFLRAPRVWTLCLVYSSLFRWRGDGRQ